ncbi:phosphoglucosamine mutase [Dichotomicrobium thermohalophilum]|uniref:Phosphoglucosamine mutase n=1 Tax=Dichotomicrobium thermohalophilum TaxID=933063 RepID=A0A397Q921_9HYPH|nr:phosphoglucosamine mutase [Dichotomicrobium thermohalophilum]RIA56027.1 phosphoglucosamine mutase [Dichotomicrobium thermohalophilum]
MGAYFGTDGIRGKANNRPMTAETALKVGMAAGHLFTNGERRHRVVIGKDTRLSGYMIESALTAGFTSVGMDVFLLGPIPTPAVAMLTRSLRADLGVMISASHNPYYDNGIKLFGPDSYKLCDEKEAQIEQLIENGGVELLATPERMGRARRIDGVHDRYIEYAKRTLDRTVSLTGKKVVIDAAHGAAYKVAPLALWELGAEVIPIGVQPDGFNINDHCGSTHPEALCTAVRKRGADIGIALDGDADRVLIADERGELIDGDQILALIAEDWKRAGRLRGDGIAATVMSNLGLERHLNKLGLGLERTPVGDRQVVERMRQRDFNLGGEQSGHIILSDYTTTGDGLVTALQVLSVVVDKDAPVSEVCHRFNRVPQFLENVRYESGKPLESDTVQAAIARSEQRLGNAGRLLIRPSGTEPVIRVMAEGDDSQLVQAAMGEVIDALRAVSA